MEERDINVIDTIQRQKEKDLEGQEPQPLNEEGAKLAEEKRFTFDVINVPNDPLR